MAEDYLVADPAAKPDFPRRGVDWLGPD